MPRDLLVILGSGFSQPAELPIGEEINDFFMRDNSESILQFGSGEFKWIDFANAAEKSNGRNNSDYLAFGVLLNQLVKMYSNENDEFKSYEEFYQYVIDNFRSPDLTQFSLSHYL